MTKGAKYRQYAEECRRIAQSLSAAQRKIMLEIAGAWLRCAEEDERNSNKKEPVKGSSGNGSRRAYE
jgi:hypothetical protein